MIKKNNQTIDKIYKGSVEIAKIYKGLTLVYENYRDMVVSGNDVINITKAKANSLNYLKRFGKCEQNGTPTPDSPVDIMCNNGTLKTRKSSGLPYEYQKVEYIESSGTQYIDTGITGTQNTKVDIDFQSTATTYGSFLPFGARSGASNNCFAIWASSATIGSNLRIGFDSTNGYTGGPTTTDKYHIIHSKDGTYVNNELVWTTATFSTFTTPQNLLVFGYYTNDTTRSLSAIRLYHLKLWENNIMVRDFIPCYRKSDNEVGLYDLVTKTFFTNAGTDTFIVGSDVADPYIVVVDGTPEVLTVQGKNLFGLKQWLDSLNITYTQQGEKFTITSNGSLYTNPWVFSDTDVKVKFSCKSFTNETTTKVRITFLDTDDNIVSSRYANDILTLNVTASKCRFDWSRGGTFSIEEAQIELGSTATAYEPYVEPQTASVQDLLAVGNYKDEQDIISGTVTRKCGVLVMDGTENWSFTTTPGGTKSRAYVRVDDAVKSSNDLLSNQLSAWNDTSSNYPEPWRCFLNTTPVLIIGMPSTITTKEEWKDFLAEQYANGNPVIVLYPLATETTESVTAQPVNIQKGANTIQVTQASINDLELEIKYKGK